MTMKQRWNTICGRCGKDGPVGESSPASRALAETQGWVMGQRDQKGGREDDICPECFAVQGIPMCEEKRKVKGEKVNCTTPAMWRISFAGKDYYGCGSHAYTIMRDLIHSMPNEKVMWELIRKAYGNYNPSPHKKNQNK